MGRRRAGKVRSPTVVMNRQLLGIVLCGGRSSRMRCDKASLSHPAGGTFLQHAVDRLIGLCGKVAVSGQPTAGFTGPVIQDPVAHRGPATGIATVLRFAIENCFDACLVTPVDMPFLTSQDLARLRDAWQQHQQSRLCCAVSSGDDRLQPLVAIYPTAFAPTIQQLADSEDRSLMRWMQVQKPLTITLSMESCRNINAPEDLRNQFG